MFGNSTEFIGKTAVKLSDYIKPTTHDGTRDTSTLTSPLTSEGKGRDFAIYGEGEEGVLVQVRIYILGRGAH